MCLLEEKSCTMERQEAEFLDLGVVVQIPGIEQWLILHVPLSGKDIR